MRGGLLARGARLPTMRALAADLGVATGTVARAYAELEAAGLVAGRRRTGTVVTGPEPAPAEDAVRATAATLAAQAHAAGLDAETVLAVVRAALRTAGRADHGAASTRSTSGVVAAPWSPAPRSGDAAQGMQLRGCS